MLLSRSTSRRTGTINTIANNCLALCTSQFNTVWYYAYHLFSSTLRTGCMVETFRCTIFTNVSKRKLLLILQIRNVPNQEKKKLNACVHGWPRVCVGLWPRPCVYMFVCDGARRTQGQLPRTHARLLVMGEHSANG